MVDAFYSDPHFGHAKIIEYCNRPFADAEEMTKVLIERYNEVVSHDDTVLWVGDCFFKRDVAPEEILQQMNGRKLLVLGNHDRSASAMARLGFDVVARELHMFIEDRRVLVNHYPYWDQRGPNDDRDKEMRPRKVKGEVLIHGHTHSLRRKDGSMVHVGVDAWDYRPVRYAEVAALVREI